jgi:hypothetical protein
MTDFPKDLNILHYLKILIEGAGQAGEETRAQFFFVALCFVLMLGALCSVLMLSAYRVFWSSLAKHKARSKRTEQMASWSRAQFFCRCFVLCAHALCSVLRAHALCLSGFLVTARQAGSTKHGAYTR